MKKIPPSPLKVFLQIVVVTILFAPIVLTSLLSDKFTVQIFGLALLVAAILSFFLAIKRSGFEYGSSKLVVKSIYGKKIIALEGDEEIIRNQNSFYIRKPGIQDRIISRDLTPKTEWNRMG